MSERGLTHDDDATTTPGFISLHNCEELARFDQLISGDVSNMDRDSGEAVSYMDRLYTDFYEPIFQDVDLYRRAKDFTRTWTSWDKPSDFVDRMADAWQRVLSSQELSAYYEQLLYDLYSSRIERW